MKDTPATNFGDILLLPGYSLEDWIGVHKDGSRAVIPEGASTNLCNIRFVTHDIIVRGGQSKDNSSPLAGTLVSGIFESNWGDEPSQRAPSRIYYIQEP